MKYQAAYVEELAWITLMPDIEARKAKLVEAVKSARVRTEIQDTPIPNEIFRNAVIAGSNIVKQA